MSELSSSADKFNDYFAVPEPQANDKNSETARSLMYIQKVIYA